MRRSRTFLYALALAGGLVIAGGVVGLNLRVLADPAAPPDRLSWTGDVVRPTERPADPRGARQVTTDARLRGAGGVVIFSDQAAFENYCQTHGKLLKGVVEDFEAPVSNVPDGGLAGPLADPLEGNVPNVDAAGLGFPNGLANKNLLIASNINQENPPPGPLGAQFGSGLVAVGLDFWAPGVPNSVKVGANVFAESMDLYFDPAENHTGVGFTLEEPLGGGVVHIDVFNKSDQVIYKDVIDAPTGAKTFFGIWSPETIGRINIGGPGGELVDEIQMWMEQPPTIFFFEDPVAFRDFNVSGGKTLKGIETFEEAVIDPNQKITLFDPLEFGVPNPPAGGVGFPNGLAEPNLIIQTNLTRGPNPPDPNPTFGDPTALFVIGPGFMGANSKKVGEDMFLQGIFASLDLIFTEPNHTGVGFWLSRFSEDPLLPNWHISIYDKADTEIGKYILPWDGTLEPSKTFFGVWSEQTIGRINIFDEASVPTPDAVDNIEMWLEAVPPKCADLDGDGDVDLDDFGIFASCFNGSLNPPAANCPPGANADLDNDGDVDLDDFGIFAACFNGSLNPPAATCQPGC